MNGYQITIYRLVDKPDSNREDRDEIYDQKVEQLDVTAVIAVVNTLPRTIK